MNPMKKMIFLALCHLLLIPAAAFAQYSGASSYMDLYDSETVSALKAHVRELSSAMMEGRKAGSEGEKLAAAYVEDRLRDYGVDVLSPRGGETFGLKSDAGDTLTSRNVVGFVQGYDRALRDRYIVVGARLDNLGDMVVTVDGEPVTRTFYGANGNASGLALMLELARMIHVNSILCRRSVIFVAFGASAETFAGAWYFLNRSFSDVDRIDAMVNLDMLGTGYNGFYAYTSSNADMNSIIRTLAGGLQPVLPEIVSSEIYPSDHRAFYAKEIPSVMFTTGRYPEHNTERDTQSVIDWAMMERELEYIYNFTVSLACHEGPVSFRQSVSQEKSRADDGVVAFNDCDQKPMFLNSPDPRQFLQKWVYQYLKYPASAVRDGIQGRVLVDFIIGKDGKVTDVRVLKGVSEELDAEAVKVVAASPKWKPGRVNGNKVRTSMTIPVEFRLEKKGKRPSFGIKK